MDREQERDETQREIASLREQLRDGDRTRASCEQINKEVRLVFLALRMSSVHCTANNSQSFALLVTIHSLIIF